MTIGCEMCRLLDAEWPIADTVKDDLTFRRKRRTIFHVQYCMTNDERAVWVARGGLKTLRRGE